MALERRLRAGNGRGARRDLRGRHTGRCGVMERPTQSLWGRRVGEGTGPASAANPLRWWRIEFSLGRLDRVQVAEVRIDLVGQVAERRPAVVPAQPAQMQDEPVNPYGLVHGERVNKPRADRLDGAQTSRFIPGSGQAPPATNGPVAAETCGTRAGSRRSRRERGKARCSASWKRSTLVCRARDHAVPIGVGALSSCRYGPFAARPRRSISAMNSRYCLRVSDSTTAGPMRGGSHDLGTYSP